MKLLLKKGTTSKQIYVFMYNSSTGVGINTAIANMTGYYIREGQSSATNLSLTGTGAVVGTWNSTSAGGAMAAVDATHATGLYTLDLPNAALANGANTVAVVIQDAGSNNIAPCPVEIQLVDFDPNDSTGKLGLARKGRPWGTR